MHPIGQSDELVNGMQQREGASPILISMAKVIGDDVYGPNRSLFPRASQHPLADSRINISFYWLGALPR
jgi:hypothetical protein